MQRLKVGDLVQVVAGREKGKEGRITKLIENRSRVIIEGLNKRTRHTRPSQENTEGGRIEFEAPIAASNVMPIDAETGKPTRVKIVTDEKGKRRISVAGNELKQ